MSIFVDGCIFSVARQSDLIGWWIVNGIKTENLKLDLANASQFQNNETFVYKLASYQITDVSPVGSYKCVVNGSNLKTALHSQEVNVVGKDVVLLNLSLCVKHCPIS